MMPAFGLTFSVVFASVSIFVNGFCINFCWLLPLGHPVHGWHKHREEEFDLTEPLKRLERGVAEI